MSRRLISLSVTLVLLAATDGALGADASAGKAKAQQTCAECHEAVDWKGKSEADLRSKITDVVAGKAKHPKKPALTPDEIANIAAYWASGVN